MAAMAIRCFLCTIMAAFALRSKAPEEALNLDDFAALCDEEIVNDTCRLLNEGDKHEAVEQFTTWEEIAEHLSAEPGFLEKFKERMGYAATDGKVWIECKPLCLTIVGFIKQVGVVPPKSDIACYTPMDETFCDLDVRPSMLKTLGPKSDADLPDFGDDLFLKTTGKLVEQEHSAVKVELATDPGMPMDSDTPLAAGVTYNFWEALERLANLFRIYPDPGPLRENAEFEDGGSSLMQRSVQSRMRGMTPDQARLNLQKEEMAKAYMGLVIRAFSAKETQDHMKKWFGRDSFYNPMARKEVLRVMNSVDHMISNVHYVYPGAMCTERTFAYVYPKGGACEENQLEKYACRTLYSDRNRFIFYLCPFYFTRPLEMVETLVHEGSHHATAYTDDVEFQGSKAYGRRTCKELARKEPLQALKNADNFCYYIQDAAEAVQDHPGEQVSAKCPTMAKFKQPDNDGDCHCPKGTQCHFGGRLGCPFSASPRRNVHSASYFNAGCLHCSCEEAVTTTEMWGWDQSRFDRDWTVQSEPESEPEGTLKCPEHSALPIADSEADCYCSGGRHCFMLNEKGCVYSGTNSRLRLSPLYFRANCSECKCMLDG